MDSGFMEEIARLLADRAVRTLRFEFAYMATRRAEGSKRPPDRMPKLELAFREAFAEAQSLAASQPLFIGGKSMGGRVASHLVDDLGAAGLVCLGYPFHPPGRPEKLRTEHLSDIQAPALIVQGERDPFGKRDEVNGYTLSPSTKVFWTPDGDHDQKPRKASGFTHDENLNAVADAVASFMGVA
jgi:predicted alpha/beta-hydrolase family hydrolase